MSTRTRIGIAAAAALIVVGIAGTALASPTSAFVGAADPPGWGGRMEGWGGPGGMMDGRYGPDSMMDDPGPMTSADREQMRTWHVQMHADPDMESHMQGLGRDGRAAPIGQLLWRHRRG